MPEVTSVKPKKLGFPNFGMNVINQKKPRDPAFQQSKDIIMNTNLQDILPKSFATHMRDQMQRREAFEAAGIDIDDFYKPNDPIFDKIYNTKMKQGH